MPERFQPIIPCCRLESRSMAFAHRPASRNDAAQFRNEQLPRALPYVRGRTSGGPTLPALSDRSAPGAGDRTVGSRSPAASTRGTGTRSPVRSRRPCKPRVYTAPLAGFPDRASPCRACGWRLPSGSPALAGDPVRRRLLSCAWPPADERTQHFVEHGVEHGTGVLGQEPQHEIVVFLQLGPGYPVQRAFLSGHHRFAASVK